jgi:hypothetical protein
MKSNGIVQIDNINFELWEKESNVFNLEITTTEGEFLDSVGLWFENNSLVDYDGVFLLSKKTIAAIQKFGFDVPGEFF